MIVNNGLDRMCSWPNFGYFPGFSWEIVKGRIIKNREVVNVNNNNFFGVIIFSNLG
jgi:hypothetical protein